MILLDATLAVPADGRLVVNLPPGSPAGSVRVLVTDAAEPAPDRGGTPEPDAAVAWPVLEGAGWPADTPLTRTEMYDDDGR